MPASKDKLETTLHQVDLKTAELAALIPIKPADSDRLWKKFRLEWNYNSNHIEGNTLTYSETELLLIFDQTPAEPHTLRELEEMKAHDVAVALIRQWAADPERELSEADIRSLNETILVRPFWKEAVTPDGQSTRRLISVGEYKKQPNSVRLPNGEMFHYTAPEEVKREMGELIDWYRTEGGKDHPVVTAALLHYRFVRVHPFDDGNGRISRLLLNYHLLRNELPPIVIKSADKQNYLFALQRADVGDLDAFCTYVAEQLHWSLELSIKAAKGESVEEVGDWEKEVELILKNNQLQEASMPKIPEIIIKIYYDSIKPFIGKLKLKLLKIDPLFHYKEIIEDYKGGQNFSPKDDVQLLFDATELGHANILDIDELSWQFFWKGYKFNNTNSFDLNFKITISLKPFNYRIFSNDFIGIDIEKPYNMQLAISEINDMIDIIGRVLASNIQKRSESSNPN